MSRPKKYQKVKEALREETLEYRKQGLTYRKISETIGRKMRTLMSIKQVARKKDFTNIEEVLIQRLSEESQMEMKLSMRRVMSLIRRMIKISVYTDLNNAIAMYNDNPKKQKKIKFDNRKLLKQAAKKFLDLQKLEVESYQERQNRQQESHSEETSVSEDYDPVSYFIQKEEFPHYDDQEGLKLISTDNSVPQ